MEEIKMPELFTPETINAIAANAEAFRNILSSGDEKMALTHGCDDNDCCCPKFLKFKFVCCWVVIINKNAECEKDHHDH